MFIGCGVNLDPGMSSMLVGMLSREVFNIRLETILFCPVSA
jgi:hypothetical protein